MFYEMPVLKCDEDERFIAHALIAGAFSVWLQD